MLHCGECAPRPWRVSAFLRRRFPFFPWIRSGIRPEPPPRSGPFSGAEGCGSPKARPQANPPFARLNSESAFRPPYSFCAKLKGDFQFTRYLISGYFPLADRSSSSIVARGRGRKAVQARRDGLLRFWLHDASCSSSPSFSAMARSSQFPAACHTR